MKTKKLKKKWNKFCYKVIEEQERKKKRREGDMDGVKSKISQEKGNKVVGTFDGEVLISRRKFLKGIGAITGLLALEKLACAPKKPEGEVPPEQPWKPPSVYHDLYPKEYQEEFVPSTCWIGKQDCSLVYRVIKQNVNGKEIRRVVKADGLVIEKATGNIVFNPDEVKKRADELLYNPRNKGTLCPKGAGANVTALYAPNRVKYPLKRINRKGEPGKFVRISWEEAKNLIAQKLNEVKQKGEYILWQKGRSKSGALYDNAFTNALKNAGFKLYKIGHGAYCSDAGYRACEYTIAQSAVLNPDFKYTRYILNIGTGFIGVSGGNKLCFITWPQMLTEAKEKGQIKKVVTLDPQLRSGGNHTDEWIPLKPGTDLAFFLGISHYLIKNRLIDKDYLKKYTNAAFLVIVEKGHKKRYYFAKNSDGKPLIYDKNSGTVVPFDQAGADPILFVDESGITEIKLKLNNDGILDDSGENVKVKPAVEAFFDILDENGWTADWADRTCGIPSLTTARIARELYENSGIKEGLTVEIEGKTLPLRPVSCMLYHLAQTELGFLLTRAILLTFMLLGAVGVPGGVLSDWGSTSPHANFTKFGKMDIKNPPYDFTLDSSKYFPITSPNPSFLSRVLIDPSRYEVDEKKLPRVMFVHMFNLGRNGPDIPSVVNGFSEVDMVIWLAPWLTEGASLLADIVLPIATIEKYEGPLSGSTIYEGASALRVPPVPPLYESKSELEAYIEICEVVGALYGDKGYIAEINKELKLTGTGYELDVNKKPTPEEIFDKWARAQNLKGPKGEEGLEYIKKYGVSPRKNQSAKSIYPILWDYWGGWDDTNKFEKRFRFWGESLKKAQDKMKEMGLDENKWIYVKDYFPVPLWRHPTMEKSPSDYSFYLITPKMIEYKQTRSAWIPVLADMAQYQHDPDNPTVGQVAIINRRIGKSLGISDGDEIYVESINPLTGEVRRVKVRASLAEYVRPDCVLMFYHLGEWAGTKREPSPNMLGFASEGFVAMTQDQSFQVKVKIYKA